MNQQCYACGNTYDKCLEISVKGKSYQFDCFECAIHVLAPQCDHCGCKIIGHGMEQAGVYYCCAHCASKEGKNSFKDREK